MCSWSASAAWSRPSTANGRRHPTVQSDRRRADGTGATPDRDAARHRTPTARRFKPDRDVREWNGRYEPYDLVKEFLIAFVVVVDPRGGPGRRVLVARREAGDRASRGRRPNPVDFAQTAITELDGTSGTATYGPPYNNTAGAAQSIGPFSPEQWLGVHHPIDTAQDFVIGPLGTLPDDPHVQAAVAEYKAATPAQQQAWTAAYEKAVANATFKDGSIGRGARRLRAGRPPSIDCSPRWPGAAPWTAPCSARSQFYGTDYTKPLLFIADGTYLANLAQNQHLSGDQWGMMNETGNYPGQAWLWLYTLWYQVPPMNTSSSGDLQVWAIMMILTLVLVFLPFIPGLRSIPRWSRVYRLIWRRHYRELAARTG